MNAHAAANTAHDRFRIGIVAMMLILCGCQTIDGNSRTATLWRTPELTKLNDVAELRRQMLAPLPKQGAKIIFVGVYGGTTPSWDQAEWFDPRRWPPYREIDLSNERDLNELAYHHSVMHVIALKIGRLFPNSVTLMIRGDSEVVSEIVRSLYSPGDKIFLAGHSFGGGVVSEVVTDLKRRKVPVQMVAYIESMLSNGSVPANVRRAFNFYVPVTFSLCPGRSTIAAEDSRATRLINITVQQPHGPYTGFCAEHRNIDSDPRVWKPIVEYLTQSAAS